MFGYGGVCFGLLYGSLAFFEHAREGHEYHDRRYRARDEVRDPFGQVHALKTEKVRERKAQRDEDHDLSQYGEDKRGLGLTQRDIDVLQSHLHEKHYRTH